MKRMPFSELQSLFSAKYPHGTIVKQGKEYIVCFDARDSRSQTEKEMEQIGIATDKRKYYTYKNISVKDLAAKLKLIDYTMSTANQEWEQSLKENVEYDDLFGE